MSNLLLSPRAKLDLEEIYDYTFLTWSLRQAERYQDDLFDAMQLIVENNKLGVKYPYAEIEYRKLHVNRHLIFYRMVGNDCLVVRILHDRMDLRMHL